MEIQICSNCKGSGEVELKDNYRDYEIIDCKRCEGTGRVYVRTYTLIVPYGNETEYYALDTEFINLLRESKKCQS